MSTSFAFVVMIGDEFYTVFEKDSQIPTSSTIVLKELYTVKDNAKILLFSRDGNKLRRLGIVRLNVTVGVPLQFPLELTFKIPVSGMMEIYWSTGSAKIIYDFEQAKDYIRRNNLRI